MFRRGVIRFLMKKTQKKSSDPIGGFLVKNKLFLTPSIVFQAQKLQKVLGQRLGQRFF